MTDCTALVEKAESANQMPQDEADARSTAALLRILICDLRKGDRTWDEIGKVVSLPGYVCKVIAGETVGRRPSVDKQSGR